MQPNACLNRPPFRSDTQMQDGWIHIDGTRLPRMVRMPFRMSQDCKYSQDPMGYGQQDPRCTGCRHKNPPD
jgi:hypothetical protein